MCIRDSGVNLCYRGLFVDPAPGRVFDIAVALPNRLALSYGYIRCVTEFQFQGLSRGITYEQSYGYVHYKLP